MPLLDKITVTTQDLKNILELLQEKRYDGPVDIIDTNGTITVRDISGMSLGDVKRDTE